MNHTSQVPVIVQVGSLWREKANRDAKRVVEVVAVSDGYITVRTVSDYQGQPPRSSKESKLVRRSFTHRFRPADRRE